MTGKIYVWEAENNNGIPLCPNAYQKMITRCSKEQQEKISPAKLIEMWGAPNSDAADNGSRELVYDQKLAWRGVVVFLIIPIPLLIPMGHDEARFVFNKDRLVKVSYVDNFLSAAVCGLHSEGPNGFGCMTDWH